uniref:Pecanex_C domain-containing protein n=1 Tax=Macrostomum lignano TaxID=282301 RepID=A0A1I8FFB5_9PLAT
FGDRDEAMIVLHDCRDHRVNRGIAWSTERLVTDATVKFVWQHLRDCDSAWRFCFNFSDRPPTLTFLPAFLAESFPMQTEYYVTNYFAKFDALLHALRIELLPWDANAQLWIRSVAERADADVQELVLGRRRPGIVGPPRAEEGAAVASGELGQHHLLCDFRYSTSGTKPRAHTDHDGAVHRPHGHDNPAGVAAARAGVLKQSRAQAALSCTCACGTGSSPGASGTSSRRRRNRPRQKSASSMGLPVSTVGSMLPSLLKSSAEVLCESTSASMSAASAIMLPLRPPTPLQHLLLLRCRLATEAGRARRRLLRRSALASRRRDSPTVLPEAPVGRQDGFALPDLLDHLSNNERLCASSEERTEEKCKHREKPSRTQTLSMGELDGQTKWLKLAFFFSVIGFCLLLYTSFFWGGAGGQAVAVLAYLFYVATVIMVHPVLVQVFLDRRSHYNTTKGFLSGSSAIAAARDAILALVTGG